MDSRLFRPDTAQGPETSPHFAHLLRKIARGFALRARREEKQWLFHCDDEQRSHRRKERARAAKRADAATHRQTWINRMPQRNRGICARRCEKCGVGDPLEAALRRDARLRGRS
jgi:hypothetical protein